MTDNIPVTVKRESDTRWSACEAAVRVIANTFDELVGLLQSVNEDVSESSDTRQKSGIMINNLLNFLLRMISTFFE